MLHLRQHTALGWIVAGCLVGCLILASCAAPDRRPTQLTVMAAASLSDALTELGQAFTTAHPGVDLQFNFAGSQQLVFQLAQGAPADVFASADAVQMAAAIASGRVLTGTPQSLATNSLVIVYPVADPANLNTIDDLARPGLKLLVADPNAPVGRYTQAFFDQASQSGRYGDGFGDQVRQNIVSYEENVKAVLSKILLGEADAGVVYTSDIVDQAVGVVDIPGDLNMLAQYYVAPVANSGQAALAQAFVDLAVSPTGQTILANHGFGPAMGTGSPAP